MKKIILMMFAVVMMGLTACNNETDTTNNISEIINEIETVKMDEVVDGVSLLEVEEIEINADDTGVVDVAIKEFMTEYGKEIRYSCVYYGGVDVTDAAMEYANQYIDYLIEQGYEEISSPLVGNVTTYAKGKDVVSIELLFTKDKETSKEECALIVEYYK